MPTNLLTLSIQDADGQISPVSVYVSQDGLTTEADLIADYLEPLWDAVRPLVTGVLVDAFVTVQADISGFTNNTPTALSDIQEKALFTFRSAGGNRPVTLSLPTIKESIFTLSGAGFAVDDTNSDVAVFTVLMTEDLGSAGINATDSHGVDLVQYMKGIQYFKG